MESLVKGLALRDGASIRRRGWRGGKGEGGGWFEDQTMDKMYPLGFQISRQSNSKSGRLVYSWVVFFHSRVIKACPVATDLIVRVNARTTT